jgi:hypothetical protein
MPNGASTSDDLAPQNRGITGVPGGEATQFKPGQSGNPGGRPKRKPITEALEKVFTPEQCLAVAQALLKKAKKGSISHVQEAANRLEGRVEAANESAGGVTFNVVISAPRPHRPAIGGSGHDEHDRG